MRGGALIIRLATLVALLLGPASDVIAQSVFIGPLKSTNPDDASAVSAECDTSADSRQMSCNFIQIRVDLAKKPEAAAVELEEQLREATPQEIGKTCKDLRKDMAELAAKIAVARDVAPRLKVFFTGWVHRFNTMCDRPTTENIRDFGRYVLQKDIKTCRIWANPWKETFSKQFGDRWVSNRGPSGVCGTVVISTLESKSIDPKKPDPLVRLWTYETQKIVTNKDVGSLLCQLDEAKVRYSWDAKDFDRSCEFIEFGF